MRDTGLGPHILARMRKNRTFARIPALSRANASRGIDLA
jgi:hypothetical protein